MFKVFNRRVSDPSSLRTWANRCEKENEGNEHAPPVQVCSDVIIFAITRFCDPPAQARPGHRRHRELARDEAIFFRSYCGDATIFEVGCYVYFMLDLWCHKNKRDDVRDNLLPKFMHDFVTVCEREARIPNAGALFDARLAFYGSLVRKDMFKSRVIFLESLIQLTQNNEMPQPIEGDTPPIVISGFMEGFRIKSMIYHYMKNMLPSIIRNCELIGDALGRAAKGTQ